MYSVISAIGVEKGINKRWRSIDLMESVTRDLYLNYRKIYLTLAVEGQSEVVYLDMERIADRYATYLQTVDAMLLDNGSASLPTQITQPIIDNRTAKFSDATRACYHATPWHPLYGGNAAPETNTALLLTRDDPVTDYTYFHRHCLVSINGFYHVIDTNGEDGVVVYDAMKSLRQSRQNQIGLLSFANVCTLKTIPITSAMVHKRLSPEMLNGSASVEPYSKIGFIKLNEDLTGKSIMLVIGGYLHAPDSNLFSKVNDNEIIIDFQRLPMFDRYYESNQYLDLSALGLSMTNRNPTQISVEELLSDEVLVKYLTLSQSFVVVLDTPELYAAKQYIKKTGIPGQYISYTQPNYPLVLGVGRMPEYWSAYEDQQWALTVQDNVRRARSYNTTDPLRLRSLDATTLPVEVEFYHPAYLLEIGTDLEAP
jgi:hypothetical protein